MQDAARYFQDVLMLSGEDENVAAALDNCMADLGCESHVNMNAHLHAQ